MAPHPPPASAPSPVGIERRSDGENLLLLILVLAGLASLLVYAAELKHMKSAAPLSGHVPAAVH